MSKVAKQKFGNKNSKFKDSSKGSTVDAIKFGTTLNFLPGTQGTGRVSGSQKTGIYQTISYKNSSGVEYNYEITQSMVAKIFWLPSFGEIGGIASANPDNTTIQTAMFKYFTNIRKRNVSLSSFDSIDVFKAFVAIDSLNILLSDIRIRLAILSVYGSHVNAAYPGGLLAAYDIAPSDIENLPGYIAKYNQLVAQMSGLALPADVPMFLRHANMASTIYKDDNGIDKAALYCFRPIGFYYLDVSPTSATVGQLIYHDLRPVEASSQTTDIETELAFLADLITKYSHDADFNDIYSEIHRAYPDDSNLMIPSPIGDDLSINFSEDTEMLDAIKNGTLLGMPSTASLNLIENATTGLITYSGDIGPEFYANIETVADSASLIAGMKPNALALYKQTDNTPVIYCHENQPDELQVLRYCAFKCMYTVPTGEVGNVHTAVCFGSELLCYMTIYQFHNGSFRPYICLSDLTVTQDPDGYDSAFGNQNAVKQFLENQKTLITFNYIPTHWEIVRIKREDSTVIDSCYAYFEYDLDNRIAIDYTVLNDLHIQQMAYLLSPKVN